MPIDIPFGATDGMTAASRDIDISIGKLYSGGKSIYLFVQNKIEKKSVSYTCYASCAKWLVVAINKNGTFVGQLDTPTIGKYPLENASAGWQEEPNIIWKPNPNNPDDIPEQITGTNANIILPATVVECISIIGCNVNYSIAAKMPAPADLSPDATDSPFIAFDPPTFFGALATELSGVCNASVPNVACSFNRSLSVQKQRTDWQVATGSGKGYIVNNEAGDAEIDGFILSPVLVSDKTGSCGGSRCYYCALNISSNAKGDLTKTETIFKIRSD